MPGTAIFDGYHAKRKELVDQDVSMRRYLAEYESMRDVERAAGEIDRTVYSKGRGGL